MIDDISGLYRRLTRDGSVVVKEGEVVLKDPARLLDLIEETLPEAMPTRQKLVLFTLIVQERWHLTAMQAMGLWEELEIADSEARRAARLEPRQIPEDAA
jgi:hypothetical protein